MREAEPNNETMRPLVLARDESGNDGENLLAGSSPVFVHASVTIGAAKTMIYRDSREGFMKVKRGHMVSKGYLSPWADERNRVDVIDVQDDRGFTTAIGNATVVSYAYDPKVLTHDLERAYSMIEDAGIPVIVKLRNGEQTISDVERAALIAFLDMHLERGRYADLVDLRVPAMLMMKDGTSEEAELALGDVMTLSQSHPDVFRLSSLPLDQWEWKVLEGIGLATGDGAVLLWRPTKDAEICTISFPLSPTRLLVIGQDLPDRIPLNARVAQNSRRWIVGTKGSLNLAWANRRTQPPKTNG